MADAKITVSAQDLSGAVLDQTAASMQKVRSAADTVTDGAKGTSLAMQDATKSATVLKDALMEAFGHPLSAVRDFSSSLSTELVGAFGAVNLAAATMGAAIVGALAEATIKAVEFGEQLQDAAYKIDATATETAALGYAADVAGGSLDQASNLVFKMQQQMELKPDTFEKGLANINLQISDLEGLDPVGQFLKIAGAFQENTTQSNRAATAIDLFTRAGRDGIPLLMKPLEDLDKQFLATHGNIDQAVKDAEELGMKWRQLKEDASWMSTEVGLGVIHFFESVLTLGPYSGGPKSTDPFASVIGGVQSMKGALAGVAGDMPHIVIASNADIANSYVMLSGAQMEAIKYYEKLNLSAKDIAANMGLSTEQVESAAKALEKDAQAATKAAEARKKFADSVRDLKAAAAQPGYGFLVNPGSAAGSVLDADNGPDVTQGLDAAAVAALGAGEMSSQAGSIRMPSQNPADYTNLYKAAGVSAGTDWMGGFSKSLDRLPDIMERAFEGGGGVGGMVKAFTTDLGANLGKEIESPDGPLASVMPSALNNVFGKALGGIAGGLVGVGISAIGGLISKIGGPSQDELDTRKARQAAGLTDATSIQADEDALTQLGVSAAVAQQMVGRALDAKTPAAFAAAMKPVNDAIALQGKLQTDVSSMGSLVSAFENAGHVLPASMVTTLQALEKMPGLTDAEKKSIQALVDAAKPNFDTLEGVAEKYGVTLQGLGPKLAQGQLDQTAQGLYKDFEDLTNAGGEAGNVIGAMHDKIETLVQQAIASGSSLPAFLQPLIQNLAGDLHDTQGNLINITKIKFDDTPTGDGLSDMQTSLDTITGQLQTDVPTALHDLLNDIPENPFAGWQVPGLPSIPGKARGGPASGLTLVGEQGPEIVNLPAGSNVTPSSETMAMLRGAGASVSSALEGKVDAMHQTMTGLRDDINRFMSLLPMRMRHAARGAI